jgi:gas vesicle protein
MLDNCNGAMWTRFGTAFVAGAAVGAGLTMLFAPYSGKATRDMAARRMHNIRTAAAHAIDEGKHVAHEAYDKGKQAVREVGNAATRAA